MWRGDGEGVWRHADEGGAPVVAIRFAVCGERGVRKEMEDEHLLLPSLKTHVDLPPDVADISLFGIFDGHGGRQCAIFAKEHLAAELATQIGASTHKQKTGDRLDDDVDEEGNEKVANAVRDAEMSDAATGDAGLLSDYRMRKSVSLAFQKLDSRIATEIPACKDGSTAVIVLLQGRQVTVATLGDAAAFLGMAIDAPLTDGSGSGEVVSPLPASVQAVPLSEVHKPWDIKEKERIIKAGGIVENGRVNGILEVSRSLGDLPQKRYGVSCTPSLKKFSYTRGRDKFLLIGCDGFWSAWSAQEAATLAWTLLRGEAHRLGLEGANPSHFDLKRICREMVEHVVLQKKAQDNVSLIIVKFDD